MDKEELRRIVMQQMEKRTDEIVEKLYRFRANPNPQTTLEVEKGLHAETTRLADAIFAEALQQTIADPKLKQVSVDEEKKKPPHA